MAKELKTSAALIALVHDRVERFAIGNEPNPQWLKIIPADPAPETNGANWKLSYSGPVGAFKNAIERVTPKLQTAYDLSPQEG